MTECAPLSCRPCILPSIMHQSLAVMTCVTTLVSLSFRNIARPEFLNTSALLCARQALSAFRASFLASCTSNSSAGDASRHMDVVADFVHICVLLRPGRFPVAPFALHRLTCSQQCEDSLQLLLVRGVMDRIFDCSGPFGITLRALSSGLLDAEQAGRRRGRRQRR